MLFDFYRRNKEFCDNENITGLPTLFRVKKRDYNFLAPKIDLACIKGESHFDQQRTCIVESRTLNCLFHVKTKDFSYP